MSLATNKPLVFCFVSFTLMLILGAPITFAQQPPTWSTSGLQYVYTEEYNPSSSQPPLPTTQSIFGFNNYYPAYELFIPNVPVTSSTPGYTVMANPFQNIAGLQDRFGCQWNQPYDIQVDNYNSYWYLNIGTATQLFLSTATILRTTPSVGFDYQFASQPSGFPGSGQAISGFRVNAGYSLSGAPATYTFLHNGDQVNPSIAEGIYFDSNLCAQSGAEYGFAHNYQSNPPADYFYYALPYDNCPAAVSGSTLGNATNGSNVITVLVLPTAGVYPGFAVSQTSGPPAIPSGTTVTQVNLSTLQITLSKNATATESDIGLLFSPKGNLTANSNVITGVTAGADAYVGSLATQLSGSPAIPAGTVVTSVNYDYQTNPTTISISLSQKATATESGIELQFPSAYSCYSVSDTKNPPSGDFVSENFGYQPIDGGWPPPIGNLGQLPANSMGYYNYYWQVWVGQSGTQYVFYPQVVDPYNGKILWSSTVSPPGPVNQAVMAQLYKGVAGSLRFGLVNGYNVQFDEPYYLGLAVLGGYTSIALGQ